MSKPWCILTRRYGDDIRSPTAEQLAEAIAELYHETLQGMAESDYSEHGAGSLRFGYDEGPMFELEVSRLCDVTFEEWADQDCEQQLAPQRKMKVVPKEHALQLWGWLARGEIEQVRAQPWD